MLKRKMMRDIRKNISQFLTIFFMVLIGIMAYSGIEGYMDGMKETSDNFYEEYNLQDLNVMGLLSVEDIDTIKEIDNVKDVEGRLTVSASLEDNDDVTISLNFIEENEISSFYIVDGEAFDIDTEGVWIDSYFARENSLEVRRYIGN